MKNRRQRNNDNESRPPSVHVRTFRPHLPREAFSLHEELEQKLPLTPHLAAPAILLHRNDKCTR
jgi:hypothetical protein